MLLEAGQAALPKQMADSDGQSALSQQRHLVVRDTNASEIADQAQNSDEQVKPKPILNDNSGGTGEAYQFQPQTGEK